LSRRSPEPVEWAKSEAEGEDGYYNGTTGLPVGIHLFFTNGIASDKSIQAISTEIIVFYGILIHSSNLLKSV